MIEALKNLETDEQSGEPLYSFDEIKSVAHELIEITPNTWLAYRKDGEIHVEFGLFEFAHASLDENDNETNTRAHCLFHGSGIAANLRELRHMWWGHRGYTNYLPANAVIAALNDLGRYFDLD
jgi:hypothetical protein